MATLCPDWAMPVTAFLALNDDVVILIFNARKQT